MEAAVNNKPINRMFWIKWAITCIVPIIIFIIPVNELFTDQIRLFLMMTSFAILIIAFELMDIMIPSIFLPLGYLLLGVAPIAAIYSAWANPMPWMFLAVFAIANAFERVGLIERIAYWCVIKISGGFRGLVIAVFIAGTVLSFVLPGGNAHVPLLFFAYGICKAMNWNKTKESTVLFMIVTLSTYGATKFILPPGMYLITAGQNLVIPELMTVFSYFKHNAIFLLWSIIAMILIYKLMKPNNEIGDKTYFHEKYKALGKITKDEKKAILVGILVIIMIMTMGIHKIAMGWCFVIVACLMYFPFINLGTAEDIKKVNYSMPFFVAACMSIGTVASVVGIGDLITAIAMPYLSNVGTTGFFFMISLIVFVGNFIMTPFALLSTLAQPLTQLAMNLGINYLPVWYALYHSTSLFVLPYEYVAYLFMFSFGMMELKDFVKVYAAKSCGLVIFILIIALPYWRFIGIL